MAIARRGHDFDAGWTSCLANRIVRVVDDVEKDLLQLVRIANDLGEIAMKVLHNLDAVTGKVVGAQLNGAAQDRVELQGAALRWHLTRETEKVLNDLLGTLGLLQDDVQVIFCLGRPSFQYA
jgi:hypothetical protein